MNAHGNLHQPRNPSCKKQAMDTGLGCRAAGGVGAAQSRVRGATAPSRARICKSPSAEFSRHDRVLSVTGGLLAICRTRRPSRRGPSPPRSLPSRAPQRQKWLPSPRSRSSPSSTLSRKRREQPPRPRPTTDASGASRALVRRRWRCPDVCKQQHQMQLPLNSPLHNPLPHQARPDRPETSRRGPKSPSQQPLPSPSPCSHETP